MTIASTQTLTLGATPVEIVATLSLTKGEYRIENPAPPADPDSRIFFVASGTIITGTPASGHALPPGGRENIDIESGQRWYFWTDSTTKKITLVITQAEAGGAIAGGGTSSRQHKFYVEIFRTSSTAITSSPTGGTYNLANDLLTPPAGWSVTVPSRDLSADETVYTCRALIDPNGPDDLVTPTWLAVHLLGEAGTITQVSTVAPLSGGAEYGDVTLSLSDRGIDNAKLADDSVDLRVLKAGTPDRLLGYNATTGDPEEVAKNTKISDLDVPDYSGNADKVLSLPAGETAPIWRDEQTIPYDFELSVSGTHPLNPTATDVWFADRAFSGASNVVENDGSTARPAGEKGDVYEFDGTNWVYQGSINTLYQVATTTLAGLMSAADRLKLDGIQAGAHVNPALATQTEDGLMSSVDKTKLDGVATGAEVNVQADWSETDTADDSFIRNKITRISQLDVPDYSGQSGRFLGVDTTENVAWMSTGSHIVRFGTGFPTNPTNDNLFVFVGSATGLTNYENSGGTAIGTADVGDVARYDGTNWIYEGSVNTQYEDATRALAGLMSTTDKTKLDSVSMGAEPNPSPASTTANGLMSSADKTKLDGVATGAEVNVQADWDERTATSDAFIRNKPSIPADPVRSDWAETTTTDLSYIENKPTRLEQFDLPDYAGNDGKIVGITSGAPAYVDPVTVPTVPDFEFSSSLPNNPANQDIFLATGGNSSITDAVGTDGTTNKSTMKRGDVFVYNGSKWVHQGTLNDSYVAVTTTRIGLMTAADKSKLDGIAAGAEVNPGAVTTNADGLMTAADKVKLDGIQSGAQTNPGTASGSSHGLFSSQDKVKLDGIETGAEVNVQADWSETDTTDDSFIENKPTKIQQFDVPNYMGNDNKFLRVSSGSPTWEDVTVETDATLTGNGTSGSALSVANPFTSADKNKLDNIAAGAEVNVHSDWTETSTSSDAFIANKPNLNDYLQTVNSDNSLTGDGTSSSQLRVTTPYSAAEKAKLSGIAAGAEVNPGVASTTANGLMSSADKTKLDGISAGAGANVNADWAETTFTDPAFIENKPDLSVYLQSVGSDATLSGDGTTASPLRVTTPFTTAEKAKLGNVANNAEQNVQSNWAETNTTSDSFIRNKPTVPSDSDIDTRVRNIVPSWARSASSSLVPDTKIPAGIARDSEVTSAVATETTARTAADNALDTRVTALEGDTFDLDADVTTETTSLATGDKLLIADVSEAGNPNRFITASNAKNLFSGFRGEWNNLSGQTIAIGDIVEYDDRFYICQFAHTRTTTSPDIDSVRFYNIVSEVLEWQSGESWPQGSLTVHNDKMYWTADRITTSDPAPDAGTNRKWKNLSGTAASTAVASTTANGLMSSTDKTKLDGVASGAEVNVQADWSETDTTDDSFIQNKPTIPSDSDIDTRIRNIVPSWARSTSSSTVPDNKIPAGIARDSEITSAVATETTARTAGDNALDVRVTALEGNTGNFDLDVDVTTEATSLGSSDKFVIADVSETGDPNRYITALNAKGFLSGYRGEWNNLSGQTIYKGDIVEHGDKYYVCHFEHTRTGSGPDADNIRFYLLTNEIFEWQSGESWPVGTLVVHNSNLYWTNNYVTDTDPAPDAGTNVKWQVVGRSSIPSSALDAGDNTKKAAFRSAIGAGVGTITGVTGGTGLSGSGTSGSVTLNVANGGIGTAQIADNAVTSAKLASGISLGSSGQDAVIEDISADTTFNLETKWSAWKDRIVLFRNTDGGDYKVTIRPNASGNWSPASSDAGGHISMHPLWEGGAVELVNIGFARHDSDGRISEHSKSATAINATEGIGEPFTLVFSNNYYVGTNTYEWHVAPITQDVRDVIELYDRTVVHLPDIKAIENKVDHLLYQEGANFAIPYWPTFNTPTATDRVLKNYNYETFGTLKILGEKGRNTLRFETTLNANTVTTDDLKGIFTQNGVKNGDFVQDLAFCHLSPTVNASGVVTGSQLSFIADVRSGRLLSQLPIEVDYAPTVVSTTLGKRNYGTVLRIYGYKTTDVSVLTNAIDPSATTNAVAGQNKIRVYGDSPDLVDINTLLDGFTGADNRAKLTYKDLNDNWPILDITNVGAESIGSGINTLLSRFDITFVAPGGRTTPSYDPGASLRFYLEDIEIASWAERENTDTIPIAKLPVGSGADNKGDLIATSGDITLATNGDLSPVPASQTWTIPNTKTSNYSTAAGKIYLPTKKLSDAHNGWIVELLDTSDVVQSQGIVVLGQEADSLELYGTPETGKNVAIIIEADENVQYKGLGLAVFSNATNTHGAARTAAWNFRIKVYEWIDSAVRTQSSSSGGAEGSVGGYDILRREEAANVDLSTASGSFVNVPNATGYQVDDGATHLEVTLTGSSSMSPAQLTWLYKVPGATTYDNLFDPEDASSLVVVNRGESTSFRFSEAFFHTATNGNRYLPLRLSSAASSPSWGGSVTVLLEHEKDVNSASVKPLTLLDTPVVVQPVTLNAGLTSTTFTEVGLDVPVEWDHIVSLTLFFGTTRIAPWEEAEFKLTLTLDEMNYVGHWLSTDTLPNSSRIKGWFSVGWAHNSGDTDASEWRMRPSARNVHEWASNAPTNVPTRLVALKRDGVYLTDIMVATFRQNCRLERVSCMRRI